MGKSKKYSILENIVFYVGLVILTGLMGYLVYESIAGKSTHANLKISIVRQMEKPNPAFMAVVQNKGGTTASAVNISFSLYQHGKPVASATSMVNYIPISSKKKLWVVFHKKKTLSDSMVVSSITYLEP